MASAAATRERLFDAVTVTPAGIRDADNDLLRDAGLSRQTTRYVNEVADAFGHGYSPEAFEDAADEEVLAALTEIRGVGDWTAKMFLIFVLAREDVFPVGDLGIRRGSRPSSVTGRRAEMREYAERWSPYRSYASLYLWRASEDIAESVAEVRED